MQTLKSSVEGTQSLDHIDTVTAITELAKSAPAAVIYIVALAALYKFTNKYTPIILVVVGAVAGQFLFV